MADFCGLWVNDAVGTTREQIAGDFHADLERRARDLPPGQFVQLGICEGHGTGVGIVRDPTGVLWLVHVPLGRRKPKGTPDWVALPPPPDVG